MTTRAKMAAKTGIPETPASSKSRQGGTSHPSRRDPTESSPNSAPLARSSRVRNSRNKVLDPRATAGQHQKVLSDPQGSSALSNRRPLSLERPQSPRRPSLPPLALATLVVLARMRPPFSPSIFIRNPRSHHFEWDEVFLFPIQGSTSFEELLGVHRGPSIRQRAEGSLDPAYSSLGAVVYLLHLLLHQHASILLMMPSMAALLNSYPKAERTLGSNRYNIDLVFHLVQRLGDLGVEVTINEGQLKSNVAYRNERLESFTSLVDERRKRLYKTINGVRDMLIDSTNELAMLMGCGAFNIRQLDAETEYTDAALVAVKEMRNRLTSHRHPSSPPAPPPVLWSLQYQLPGSAETEKSGPSSPEPSPQQRWEGTTPTYQPLLVMTMTTPTPVRWLQLLLLLAVAPRHPLSRPRVYGLANTKHLTSDVEGITKKLTLLQYRELRSGSSTPSSRPPLPLLRSVDADVGKNTPLVMVMHLNEVIFPEQLIDNVFLRIKSSRLKDILERRRLFEYQKREFTGTARFWICQVPDPESNSSRAPRHIPGQITHVITVSAGIPPDAVNYPVPDTGPKSLSSFYAHEILEIRELFSPLNEKRTTADSPPSLREIYGVERTTALPDVPSRMIHDFPPESMKKIYPIDDIQTPFRSSKLKIISWNVNSLQALVKKHFAKRIEGDESNRAEFFAKYLDEMECDIACFQETMIGDGHEKFWQQLKSVRRWKMYADDKRNGHNGVMTWSAKI
ncbi:hypothetical protein BC829DRAFT_438990 [Chytridium lagenaria]|nr:hypothetical protein BC829DRAFT_438990 [Chytridium lagenaria]